MMRLLNLFLLLISSYSFAQKNDVFRIDSIPEQGILLDKGWKWHAGDNPDFAKADFDDSAWEGIDPTKTIPELNQIGKNEPLWLRTKLKIKANQEIVISIVQSGASEIFLNGNRILSFGQIKNKNQSRVAYDPQNDAFVLKLEQDTNTLSVRYYFQDKLRYNSVYNVNFPLFTAHINNKVLKSDFRRHIWNGFNIGVPFILFIVHFIFFLSYPKNKANLWYSLASLFGFVMAFLLFKLETTHSVEYKNQLIIYSGALGVLGNSFSYYTIFLFLKQKNFWLVIVFVLGSILGVALNYFDYFQSSVLFNYLLTAFYVSTVIYMGNHARKQGESGGKYLIISMIIYIIFWSLFILSFTFGWGALTSDILFHLAALILPIIISALLGLDFRNTNNLLLKNLEKINALSIEKQQILSTQNETLEKQVEARTSELVLKNRDLEIETALERVRSKTMAMHKSEELREVVAVIYEQLQQLGFTYGALAIVIFEQSSGDSDWWMAGFGKEKYPEKYRIPYFDHPFYKAQLDAWKQQKEYVELEVSGDAKRLYDEFIFSKTDFVRIPDEAKEVMVGLEGIRFSNAGMKHGALSWGTTSLEPQHINVLQRFAKVFEQTYTRFLDLQKAENQAREAQIEAALERVRSRSMAMHKSDELVEVINVVAEQLIQLNFRINTASFFLIDESEEFTFWLAAIGESNPDKIVIPKLNNPALNNIKEARRKGLDFFADTLTFEEKNEWFQHVFDHSENDRISEERKEFILNTAGYARSLVLMKQIGLFIVNYLPQPYSDAENAILIRFAKVFEQAYTRFLDLQKAEAQAREAQIEVALEMIRSRSLAMHHSDELKEVMGVMFKKLTELEILIGTVGIQLFDEKTKNCEFWLQNQHQEPGLMKLPYNEKMMKDNYMGNYWDAKSKGESFFNKKESIEQKNRHFEYVFANNPEIPLPLQEYLLQAQHHTQTFIIEKNSALLVDSWDERIYSEEQIEVLKRVAKVFEQAYIRFLDLQKAEAQAREAQIEAALEKIRSRSLAMHHSDELKDVMEIVFQKMKELDVITGTIAIQFFDMETKDSDFWVSNDLQNIAKVKQPYDEKVMKGNNYMVDCWAAKIKGENIINKLYTFEQKNEWFDYVFANNDFETIPQTAREFIMKAPNHICTLIIEKNAALCADNWFGQYFSKDEIEVLMRVAKVFEQAYTRFLDLQKAEAQAREARIEVGLERVRSRSMAMHKSDEVLDVANTLYETLQNLGFQYGACTIMIMDKKTGDMEHWVAGFEHLKYPKSYHVGYFKNPAFDAQLAAWHNGKTFLVHKLEGEEKKEYDEKMFTQTEYENFPEKEKKWMSEAESVIFSLAYMKHGALHWGPTELSHEQVNILQRFARVFEQTYTRFLDLQKAEEQARESQIQLAMERVRAKTMAMQHSNQLREIVGSILEQLQSLGFTYGACSIVIMDSLSGDMIWWIAGFEKDYPASYHIPYFDHPFYLEQLNNWKEGKKYAVMECAGKAKKAYDKVIFSKTEFVKIPAELQKIMQSFEKITFSNAYMQHGALSWSTEPLEDEHAKILQRFSGVFEQSYTRFLDLQKAEEQAREAQIEVSLERVRSRAMAMQTTAELGLVIGTVYSELAKLDLVLDRCFFMIFDTKTLGVTWWMASHEATANSKGYYLPYHEYPPHLACLEGWKERKEKWQYILEGEDKKSWDEYVFSKTELSNLPDFIIENMKSVEMAYLSASYQNFGCLATGTFEPLTDESFDILQRFSKVFDLTYTRFNDLQKAEAQAREAQIEVALERVRARAMSMQKSDELADAAQILYHEFGKLGINTFTCGYMFIDEAKQNQTAWVTLPDGTILPNYIDFPLTGDDVLDKRYASWKAKKPLHIHQVEGKGNKTHHEFLAQHVPENVAKDIFDEIPESIIFYSSNFSNGYLLILATDFFSREEEQIIIRFTKVFELTYTRFLDLELAESQAREAKIEVALERVRSKTLAMQSSVELSTIIGLIFNEMRKLDVQLQRCFFMIFNPQNLGVTWWMASFESVDLGKGYFIPYSEHRPQLAYLKGWQERQETWRHHMQGEEKASWDAFLFNDTEFKTLPPFVIDNMKSFKSIHLEASFNSFGCLTTGNEQPLSSEAFDLLIRFSKVFDLTYTRFNDIAVAEAQTREAQIEAAFERIRASALAMQTSDEFLGVVKTLYLQLNTLGQQELEATTIQFYDLEKGFINSWHAQNIDKLTEGNISLGTTQIPLDACELTLEWLEAYKSPLEDYTIVAKGEKLKEWLQILVRISPEIKDRLGNSMPEISHFHFSEFSEGALSMVSLKPFSEESKYLLKRAASAFDLAYKRYLDLQLKEEQSLKLAQEKQRLEVALKTLKSTQAQLIQSEKLASLGELTAGIAHEIQNPLNFVNNFSEVSIELANELSEALRQRGIEANSEEGELVSDLIQNQEKIHHHGKRASSIVKGMLEHSRKNSGNKELTDINALADEYLKLSYHGLRAKDHNGPTGTPERSRFKSDFKTDFDIKLPKIMVVPQDIGRVLLNLINNAFQAPAAHNGEAKHVIVKTQFLPKEGRKGDVLISVIDNGSGMSPEIKSKIFQPFFTTKPTGEGTGLGLSLAYDIVTKGHGGTIECESVEGMGTEFIVKLPI